MGFLAALPAIASAASGIFGGNRAADAQARAAQQAAAFQKQMYGEAKQNLSPYMQTGTGANRRLSDVFIDGDMTQFYESPDYQFRLGEGRKALEGGAAARGGLYSGAMGKALEGYGQSLASEEFDNFYRRLMGLSGQGQNAAGSLAGFGQNTAANVGNALMSAGDARASSYVNRANQLGGLAGVIGGSDWYKKMAGG